MMITKMDLSIDLTKTAICSTLAKKVLPTSIGNGIDVHIPILMSNIEVGEPKESPCSIKGRTMFVNDTGCRISVSSRLTKTNSLIAKKEDNASLTRVLVLDPETNAYVIPQDTKLQATFTHGKLSAITFNTNTFV